MASTIHRSPYYVEKKEASRDCPYLDTVNRSVLDFDFEKCCSVSLAPTNVYACLVCGRYFQGRGPNTQAYTHSLEVGRCKLRPADSRLECAWFQRLKM